ncbi:MAG: NAD(P)H-binding protein [Bacteroidales bacterium]
MADVHQQKGQRAAIIGATGLIGGQLVALLQDDPMYDKIHLVVRRPVHLDHPKFRVKEIDFEDHGAFKAAIEGIDVVYCAVGTTTRKVKGDRQAYRKVDVDIPLNAARFCEEGGGQQFLVVSSIGANSKSNTFYLRLKGEVEEQLKEMAIPSVSVFRPSLLLGRREEHRFSERISQQVMGPLAFMVPSRYRPIQARDVARAMVSASRHPVPGFRIYYYSEMMEAIAAHK